MRVAMFLLADAATVREGMLNILGAGANIVRRPAYPAPLGIPLVLLLEIVPEGESDHEVSVLLSGSSGLVGRMVFRVGKATPGVVSDLAHYVPIVLPSEPLPLPKPGRYRAEVQIDGNVSASVEFEAQLVPADELPGREPSPARAEGNPA